ncbi:acyl-homoserine-lactone synthase [Hyphomicrobium denitrificans 1NES1]|uniref:Acyl-homoserine-lactone synthase n=1 Tax=Hyphomicrobium denitrificans 1NES1 TaxID=670307 RepID=N0BBV6_9HYPH|nr:acyl-homoserine-lactone synthase [Hyphomicrobium denitrificans]AGK59752.1 acyl-homoserine-lactone synthase [Hyphomicrobium denitrificans 1NES1]
MLQLITPDRYGEFIDDLAEMHRLRYRIFKERLGWDVQTSGDMEIDEFDACRPVYLLQRDEDGRVQGSVRLLPTSGPTMVRDTFPALLDGEAAPSSDAIWESSRFGVDLGTRQAKTAGSIARATYELFAGMIEFGLMRHLSDIVTVTDARMERILCRAHWPLRRLGSPRPIGRTLAVAGYLEVSWDQLRCVQEAGGLRGVSDQLGAKLDFAMSESMIVRSTASSLDPASVADSREQRVE